MTDLFTEALPAAPDPFAGVVAPTSPVKPQSTLGRYRRAQLAAAANLDITGTPAEALYDQFQQIQEQQLANIELYGDGQAEAAAADRRQQRRAQGLIDLSREIGAPEGGSAVTAAISQATTEAIQYDIEQAKEAALEQEAVDRIMDLAAAGDHVQADAYLTLMETGSVLDQQADFMAKSMILQREVDRAQSEVRETPFYSHITNFLLSAIPFQASWSQTGLVDNDQVDKGFWDWLVSGDRRRSETASLWNQDPETFARTVREQILPQVEQKSRFFLNTYQDDSEQLALLRGFQESPRPYANNAFNLVDNLGWMGISEVAGATRIAKSIPSAMIGLGARKQAGAMVARAAREGALNDVTTTLMKTGFETTAEVADQLAPSIIRPQTGATRITAQAAANEALERGDAIAAGLNRIVQTGRYANDAERQVAIQEFIDAETSSVFSTAKVLDVDWSDPRRLADDNQVDQVKFTIGKTSSGGWAHENYAKRWAANSGFADATVEQIEGGTWVVNVNRVMPEAGTYIDPLQVKTTNMFSQFLLGARQRSDEFLANRAQVSDNSRNAVLTELRNKLWTDVRVDPASRARVSQMAAFGESKAAWFETVEDANMFYQRSFNRDISEKEWKSYNGLKAINDFEYVIRNDDRWKALALRGVETVNVETGNGYIDAANAVVDTGMTKQIRGRVLNMADNSITSEIDEATRIKMRNDGFQLVHLEEPFKLADGREITAIAARPGNGFTRETLRRNQLPYRAGGHRIYTDKNFVKQATRVVLDDGTVTWRNPSTFIAGTKAQADEWASVMNAARNQFLKNEGDLSAIDAVFGGRPGYPSAEKFVQGMSDGTYSRDFEFVSLGDRELPREYDAVDRSWMGETDEEGITSYLRTNGRLYYGQKGNDALVDWRGEQAPVLDAYDAVNKAFLNIANLSTFSDYKVSSVERWVKTFGDDLDPGSYPANATNMQKFLDGKPRTGPSRDRLVNALEDQRSIIKRNLGWKTQSDMRADEVGRRFGEWLMGTNPEGVRHKVSRDLINFMEDKDPLQFMRGLAFDLKLGLFNPVQLFLQAGTFLAISAIDPAGATKALGTNPLLRAYLIREDALPAMIKSGMHRAAGFSDPEEFTAFMTSAKASGFLNINESHSLVNAMGPNRGLSLSDNPLQKVRETGRFFFNEGELINRMAAMRSAWDWTKKQFPDIEKASPQDFMNQFTGRSETLSFSMSRTSQAWWQQGPASIPTQFFSYQARMMEMMFGGQLTRAERARLIGSQFFLYGAAGIPLAPVVSDLIAERTGEAPKVGTFPAIIDRGSIDAIVHALTGADVMIGERFGTGGWIGDTVGELMGFSKYGEQNTLDVLGGAGWSVTSDLFEDFKPYIKYALAESGGDIGYPPPERSFINLANNISSVSAVLRFMMIKNHGAYTTSNGNYSATGIPTEAAWFNLLTGARPGELDQLSASMSYLKNRQATVDEAAKVVEQYRTRALNEPEKAAEISEEINIFVRHLDADIRSSVLSKARTPDESMLKSAEERIQRIHNQRLIAEAMEGDSQ